MGANLWRDLGLDTRYAARTLWQRRGFAGAVVLVLALGVGATTAMFSAVDAALLRPLPFPEPERLLELRDVNVPFDAGARVAPSNPVHFVDVNDVAGMKGQFSHVAAYAVGGLNLSDPANPLRVNAGVVTSDFFTTLGVAPVSGRAFSVAEGAPNGPAVVVLSYTLWQRQYGGRDLVGHVIRLNGTSYTVVGVMPRGFSFPGRSDLWIPMSVPTTFHTFQAFRGFLPSRVIARLATGATPAFANAQLMTMWERGLAPAAQIAQAKYAAEQLDSLRIEGATTPLRASLVGDRGRALLVLLGATGMLLLIACANVTNLLLARAATRQREIALRAVLGATRGRLMRQLMTESAILAVLGTALGVALAPLALHVIRVLMPANLSGLAPAELDLRVLSFAAALALLTAVGFGLWPALGAARADAGWALKTGGGHGATASASRRARRALVVAELALALVLLVGAGLMLRSFLRLTRTDVGLRADKVGTLEMSFSRVAGGRAVRLQKITGILDRLAAVPGVTAAGVVNDLPLSREGGIGLRVTIDGAPPPPPDDQRFARYLMASGGYFRAMGIPLLRGRMFTVADDSLAPKVVVINAAMARAYWRNLDPVGRTLHFGGDTTPVTVVGIVGDVRQTGLDEEPLPQMFFPVYEQTPSNLALVARGTLDGHALLARMTGAVHAVDPAQAVFHVRTMDEVLSSSVAPRRTNTLLISLFGALALILAALGVYAVVSYGVTQRHRELGIRSALGATGTDLVRLVAREMTWVVATGVAIGLAAAWALTRLIASQLYGVEAHDPLIFILAALALLLPAAVATLVPALRAVGTEPGIIMRAE